MDIVSETKAEFRLKVCQSTEYRSPAKQETVPLRFNPQPCSSSIHPAVTIHLGPASIDIAKGTSQAMIEIVLRSLQRVWYTQRC